MRAKQAVADEIKIDRTLTRGDGTSGTDSKRSRTSAWAALIQRVYEADPLTCPRCGAKKKVISFIETRQRDVTCRPAGRSRRSSAGTRAERWSTASGKVPCERSPNPAPRRNEARGGRKTSRASCNWCSIPSSSRSFSKAVSEPEVRCAPSRYGNGPLGLRNPSWQGQVRSRERRHAVFSAKPVKFGWNGQNAGRIGKNSCPRTVPRGIPRRPLGN